MTTHSEISDALSKIAFLDPTGLLRAVQINLDRTVQAWARHLPHDVTCKEIVDAADELHRNQPAWQFRAGEISKLIDGERAKERQKQIRQREQAANEAEGRRLTAQEIEQELARQRKALRHEMKRKSA